MKHFIIMLMVCACFSVASAGVPQDVCFIHYDSVDVAYITNEETETPRLLYGLYKDGQQILPVCYEMSLNQKIGLIAFYKDTELILYDMSGNVIFEYELDFPIDKHSVVQFEVTEKRRGEAYYDLVVYFFVNDWVFQVLDTFMRREKNLYRVKIIQETELLD